jgi:hypothetical protein
MERRLFYSDIKGIGCTYDRQCIILHALNTTLEGDLWLYCYLGEDIIKAIVIFYKES